VVNKETDVSISVRFSDGSVMTYNRASNIERGPSGIVLVTAGGGWVAAIPPGANCVVEALPPCTVTASQESDESALEHLLDHAKDMRWGLREKLAELKRLLGNFDARTGTWRR